MGNLKAKKMKFTETHEWISLENGIGTVGITAYAGKELGEVVYIEPPKIGQKVKAGEEVVVLESTKAAADIYSPVSGEVIEVNTALGALNTAPETTGWLFKLKLSNPAELNDLLDRSNYMTLIS